MREDVETDKDKEGQRDKESEEWPSSMPSFSLRIEDVDSPTTSNKEDERQKRKLLVKTNSMNEAQEKTTEKLGDKLQSPYLQKLVDPFSDPTTAEALIANWMFALQGDEL